MVIKGIEEIDEDDCEYKRYLLDVFASYHPVVEEYSCCLKTAVIKSKEKWSNDQSTLDAKDEVENRSNDPDDEQINVGLDSAQTQCSHPEGAEREIALRYC